MSITLGLYLIALVVSQADDPDTFATFFKQFAANRDAINSLQAPFTQKTITPDEIVTSIGTVIYARPKRLMFRYDDPKQVYLLDGSRAYEFDAELLQVQIFDLDESPQASAFYLGFEDDAASLMEANDIRLLMDEVTGKVSIELTPKPAEDAESFFQRATLHLRKGDYLPEEIHIVNDEESETRITLGEIALNQPLDPEDLQIALPEGTDIIENDEYIETVGPGGKRIPELPSSEAHTP